MNQSATPAAAALTQSHAATKVGRSEVVNHSATDAAASLIQSHAATKTGTSVFMNQSATAAAAALIAPQTVSQISRPFSVFVKKRTSPATRAAIPAMTSPIGLALIAAFRSHCAAAAAFVQTAIAFCATFEAIVATRCRTTPTVAASTAPEKVVCARAAPSATRRITPTTVL